MSTPNAFETELWDLTALPVLVRTAFRTFGRDYVGIRRNYLSDERAWDENDLGRWGGNGAAPPTTPSALMVVGATALPFDSAAGRDGAVQLASGTSVQLDWNVLYVGDVLPLTGGEGFAAAADDLLYTAQIIRYSDGATVFEQITPTTGAVAGVLADGLYAVAVTLTGASRHMTEAQYQDATGLTVAAQYRYEEGGKNYFYDYDRNLGVRPSDPSHELNLARAAVLADNAQQDDPALIRYATSHERFQSEAALLTLMVGDESGASAGVLWPCLFVKATDGVSAAVTTANQTDYAAPFDPFARSVASWLLASSGTLYVGGERASGDGVEGALWSIAADGGWHLLATAESFSTGFCECGGLQQAHEIRRLVELENGTISAQSLCSNFRYDPYHPTVRGRLVLSPRETWGHPGGRSLLAKGGVLSWTTESFQRPTSGASIAARFYDTYQTQTAGVVAGTETGTVAHLDGNLALWKNRIYGVVQDKPDSEPDALRRVAQMTPLGWDAPPGVSYPAATQRLNRVARIGWHLVATGKAGDSQNPLLLCNDGQLIEFATCTYRVRQMDAVPNESGFETGLAPAFLPGETFGGLRIPRRVIELGERSTGRIHDGEPLPTADVPATNAQEQLVNFGAGAVWFGEPLFVWSGEVAGIAIIDTARWSSPSAPRAFTAYFETQLAADKALVWARIDSDEDADVLASYNIAVPRLNDLWMLPIAAKTKVEIVVVLPSDAEKMEALRLQNLC